MTLAICWIRQLPEYSELVMAADSRTRGSGITLNSCAKIVKLPRGDSVICYAGNTIYGYPLLIQAVSAVDSFYKSRSRAATLDALVGHLKRFFTDAVSNRDLYSGPRETAEEINRIEVSFIVGGYCWLDKKFKIYTLKYDSNCRSFVVIKSKKVVLSNGEEYNFSIVGDNVSKFNWKLKGILSKLSKVDMEPLKFLDSVIDDANYPSIGGNIQAYRVYQHLNASPLPIIKDGVVKAFGRNLLPYEILNLAAWDLSNDKLTK